jgi:NAD-dependent DNA ligase
MIASNSFGRGLSNKKLTILLNSDPHILISNRNKNEMKNYIISIDGFSDKLTEQFMNNIDKFKSFTKEINIDLNKLILLNDKILYETNNENKKIEHTKLENKKIAFSGFRNKELEAIINKYNGIVIDTINKNTNILIVKNMDDTSSKINKAKELNIIILNIDNFKKIYLN